ncbi:MAG: dipeptidase [Acidimicrobiia bacterium]|jgi:acetylornithine deacetylase/succinyl-diaminopimelate desuccinylase-like protein
MHDDLRTATDRSFPDLVASLESLVSIPSVSAPGYDPAEVRRSAEFTAGLLSSAGCPDVRLLEIEGAHPAVFAHLPGPENAPTVLLYAHHDVQPPGPADEWDAAPFQPFARDGRIYGRGTSDDKAGVMVHVGAIGALGPQPPVGIKVLVEGEEEIGSAHLGSFLDTYQDLFAADVIVILDSSNWAVGVPTLTTSLRGLVDCTVEVRTLRHAVHSGMFGGAIPDAITTLARLLATLHNEDGEVAVAGLHAADTTALDLTADELRAQAEPVDGIRLLGSGSITSRLWTKPAIAVLAVDAPPLSEAINQLVPVARAKVSLRLAPGDDPARAMDALGAHLEGNVGWGAEVTVTRGAMGEPFAGDTAGQIYDAFRTAFTEAWGRETAEMGVGGSIPFVADFATRYPEATILLTGVADPTSRAHGPNESQDLDEIRKGILAEAIALRLLGAGHF